MDHRLPRATPPLHAVELPLPTPARSRTGALIAVFVLVVATLLTGAATARPAGASNVEDAFTDRINQAREARGVRGLETRAHLVSVARDWAARMADQRRLYHNPGLTSDVNNWRWVGENVGYGPNPLAVHVAFMDSPGHKANILDRDYTEVGVGAVVRGGRIWVAEVFRRPMRATTSFATAAGASFHHTLRPGAAGATVARVQARLGLSRTGYYGRHTEAAVSRFQRSQGWLGRGNCGPKTWSRLF